MLWERLDVVCGCCLDIGFGCSNFRSWAYFCHASLGCHFGHV